MAGKRRRNPVTDEQIIASYLGTQSAYKTAKHLGIGGTTVYRVLLKHDVPRPGLEVYRREATKFRGIENDIRKEYEAGATYEVLRQKFGDAADYAYKQALRRAGTILRENPAPPVRAEEIEEVKRLHASGLGQMAISLRLGRSQSFISRLMRRNGIKPHKYSGDTHPHWKGGRFRDQNGYIRVWLAPDDPLREMALTDGYVPEHRLVMARKLGRPLRKTETVHHIDNDSSNNALENLQLRQGKHGKHAAMVCLDCGSTNIGHRKLL